MLSATALAPEEVIALIPLNYGAATVEKIAANAVMAGCKPEMMRVLIPLVRAVCDERFNIHGVQATTHFAAPLVIRRYPVHPTGNDFWSFQDKGTGREYNPFAVQREALMRRRSDVR